MNFHEVTHSNSALHHTGEYPNMMPYEIHDQLQTRLFFVSSARESSALVLVMQDYTQALKLIQPPAVVSDDVIQSRKKKSYAEYMQTS